MQTFSHCHHSTLMDELSQFVLQSKRLFVLTGAGCSTESGIPDYRDREGKWKHKQPLQYQDFIHNESARKRYWARSLVGWRRIALARPNPAHIALACLETAGWIYHLITQNVDGLHQKAGSRRVLDLHGRLDIVECLDCRRRVPREHFQRKLKASNPDFKDFSAASAPDGDALLEGIDFSQFQIPACEQCGGILKPGVTFFGEGVPQKKVYQAYAYLEEADTLLIIGSSLMVYSGYRFCRAAWEQRKPIAAINLGRTRADDKFCLKITASCSQVLPALAARLGS